MLGAGGQEAGGRHTARGRGRNTKLVEGTIANKWKGAMLAGWSTCRQLFGETDAHSENCPHIKILNYLVGLSVKKSLSLLCFCSFSVYSFVILSFFRLSFVLHWTLCKVKQLLCEMHEILSCLAEVSSSPDVLLIMVFTCFASIIVLN